MATAIRNITEQVVMVPQIETTETITLELSLEEAQVLADILVRVGGIPRTTRRGLTNAIGLALHDQGILADYQPDDMWSASYISFTEAN
jgi:hypothetical protein